MRFSVILLLDPPALLLARSVLRGILVRCAPHRSVEQYIESLCCWTSPWSSGKCFGRS